MSQILPIVATTATQWIPVKRNGNVVVYQNLNAQPIPALRKTLTISLTEPSKTSKLYKARFRIVTPVEKMDNTVTPAVGTGEVDYLTSADVTYTFDARSSSAARGALHTDVFEFMNLSDEMQDVMILLTPLY